ncbi:HEPN domain-containing protein [Myxococcus hansupus]|uniref:HEPN domain-containing protein n=1 Tax=Pseudomyxococcus hansupus TaxID=1297742 RepID=UPI000AE64E4C|nr:HEPN domain-containing protein [Myxococcus hansupus]
MSIARGSFLERLAAFHRALSADSLVDKALTDSDHNETARLLRNGLAVVGFSSLEGFIRSRTSEILGRISGSPVKFSDLPVRLQESCTFGAIKALSFQIDLRSRNGEDVTSFIQRVGSQIASTSRSTYELAELSFAHDKSNINSNDIKEILGAFGIKDGWGNISKFAGRTGLPSLGLEDSFRTASRTRNRAAHRPDADIATSDLDSFHKAALGIAIGFDALISRASRLIVENAAFRSGAHQLAHDNIPIRFLDASGSRWREKEEASSKASRISAIEAIAWTECINKARSKQQIAIKRNPASLPLLWVTTDNE